MSKFYRLILVISIFINSGLATKSVSFETYMSPVIPGDHPDRTLTKIGNDFYTSGSSFNPTPDYPSGVYVYQIESNAVSMSRKMVLLK